MQWFLWTNSQWEQINVDDKTNYLTKSDIISFSGSSAFEKSKLFGMEFYWLAGSVVEDSHPENPKLRGLFPNTVSAFQATAVEDEIIGSSDGTADQEYSLLKFPIITQEIWVNERNEPDEKTRQDVLKDEGEDAIKIEQDDSGEITAVWIRWHDVVDFDRSSAQSRHYTVDRRLGKVKFGNGINGLIPAAGANNIKANYKFGGGKIGNIAEKAITGLKNAIPFVQEVTNHLAAAGGSETETLDEVLIRGPQKLKNRERAIAPEDFEVLAKNAARTVARAKCLSGVDEAGNKVPGWVTVMIIPQSDERAPKPSRQLIKVVEKKLIEQSANVVSAPDHIHVRGAEYSEIVVDTTVIPVSLDVASIVEGRIRDELERFIHPLTGGSDGSGWPFGRSLCRSEIFSRLESIDGVEIIKSIRLFKDGTQQLCDIKLDDFTLPFSGEHRIEISMPVEDALSAEQWTASECVDQL
jgi:predicted phage baseplate assembly protein